MNFKAWTSRSTAAALTRDIALALLLSGVSLFLLTRLGTQVAESPTTPKPVTSLQLGASYSIQPAISPTTALKQAILGQVGSNDLQATDASSESAYEQILEDNLLQGSREALGYEVSRETLRQDREIQSKIMDYQIAKYWQDALEASNGDEEKAVRMVASRWYAGDANLYESTAPQFYGDREYPSIAEYSLLILDKYRQELQGKTFKK